MNRVEVLENTAKAITKKRDHERNFKLLLGHAHAGKEKKLRWLLKKGVPIDGYNNKGLTVLHCLVRCGHLKAVKLLLSCGADVNLPSKDEEGMTVLHFAVGKSLPLLKLLVEQGAQVEAFSDEYETQAVHLVAGCKCQGSKRCSLKKLRFILGQGVAVDTRTTLGRTALHWAANWGCLPCVELLHTKGATVTAVDEELHTPLHWASGEGHLEVVAFLLKQGADPNAQDIRGNTPLHWASEEKKDFVVAYMLKNGAHPDIQNKSKETALHLAAYAGNHGVVASLMASGADYCITTDWGGTALHWAATGDNGAVCEALLVGIAKQIMSSPGKQTSLFGVLCQEIINYLLVQDDRGRTAQQRASGELKTALQSDRVLQLLEKKLVDGL